MCKSLQDDSRAFLCNSSALVPVITPMLISSMSHLNIDIVIYLCDFLDLDSLCMLSVAFAKFGKLFPVGVWRRALLVRPLLLLVKLPMSWLLDDYGLGSQCHRVACMELKTLNHPRFCRQFLLSMTIADECLSLGLRTPLGLCQTSTGWNSGLEDRGKTTMLP